MVFFIFQQKHHFFRIMIKQNKTSITAIIMAIGGEFYVGIY